MSASPARRVAREVVTRVRERSAYAHELMDSALRNAALSPADAALATRLAYGTLQAEGTLIEALDRYLGGKRVEPRISDALRVSAYEILFMRSETARCRSPGRRARTRSAQTGGRPGQCGAAPPCRGRTRLSLGRSQHRREGARAPARASGVARRHVDPGARARGRRAGHGSRQHTGAAVSGGEPVRRKRRDRPRSTAVGRRPPAPRRSSREYRSRRTGRGRARAGAPTRAGPGGGRLCATRGRACRGAAGCERRRSRRRTRDQDRCCFRQLRLPRVAPPSSTPSIRTSSRPELLAERLRRYGVPGVRILVGDATDFSAIEGAPAPGSVDAVLVDAPCSGLGTLRRHPEKRWRVQPADIDALAVLGSRLLGEAARLVRRGGFVVYSTCTVAERENAERGLRVLGQ